MHVTIIKLIIIIIIIDVSIMTGTITLLELYTTLVRPHLEYVVPVWDPLLPIILAIASWKTLSGLRREFVP